MKIFIWEIVGQCSGNYHSEGGVNVLAENEERARVDRWEVYNTNDNIRR